MGKGLPGKGDVNTEAFYLSATVCVALGHTTITTLFDSFLLICKDTTPPPPPPYKAVDVVLSEPEGR